MNDDARPKARTGDHDAYEAPTIRYLGNLAELTQKEVGASDGTTFNGLDISSV